jgi:hypothetical protein
MECDASTIKTPRCLCAFTLAALIIASSFVAFSLSRSSPTVTTERAAPIRMVFLDPSDGAIIGFAIEGDCTTVTMCSFQITPGTMPARPSQLGLPHGVVVKR